MVKTFDTLQQLEEKWEQRRLFSAFLTIFLGFFFGFLGIHPGFLAVSLGFHLCVFFPFPFQAILLALSLTLLSFVDLG
jgi:hypothetical protein